jgi:hypothetical protein
VDLVELVVDSVVVGASLSESENMGIVESVVGDSGIVELVESVVVSVVEESVVATEGGEGLFGGSEITGTVELLVECIVDSVGDGVILNALLVVKTIESNGDLVTVLLGIRVAKSLVDFIVFVTVEVGITRVTGIGSGRG